MTSYAASDDEKIKIVLVGDSDVARWPEILLPCPDSEVSGHSGVTLRELLPYIDTVLDDENSTSGTLLVLIVCAGENDIGNGISLNDSVKSFEDMLERIYPSDTHYSVETNNNRFLIFLGPKFEPWLQDDIDSRKQYVQMSLSFDQCCQKLNNNRNSADQKHIFYVDCLTMFCSQISANQPGALLGGMARIDAIYFDSDELHLSVEGYNKWKQVVEQQIYEILQQRKSS